VPRPRRDRDIGVTVSRRDRDVRKNASRPSRDRDVRDRDYNPALEGQAEYLYCCGMNSLPERSAVCKISIILFVKLKLVTSETKQR